MSRITNMIDAIRRFGRPDQRSALARQDRTLTGKKVLARRHETARSASGSSERFVATVEPSPESIRPFNAEETSAITENAARLPAFLTAFLGHAVEAWGPDELDRAFSSWTTASDRQGYDDESVVQILGAAFGEYCSRTLHMRWVVISDCDGDAAAIRGVEKDFRGFPFHSVWKRIRAGEHLFFRSVYVSLEADAQRPDIDVI